MSEIIVKLRQDCIKVKGGTYVQDLVRCKECRYAEVEGRTTHYLVCQRHPYSARAVDLTDFCSEGKRKESE